MATSGQSIRQQAETVATLFEALVVLCPPHHDSRKAGNIVAEDQLGRFRIWASNIGVNAKGHGSLDHRLRDSQEARELMFELLGTLENHIQKAIEINKSTNNEDSLLPSDPESVESVNGTLASQSTSAISSAFNGTETASFMELIDLPPFEDQMRGIELSIDRLYRLSVAIRRPSLLNRDRMAAKFVMRDEDGYENEVEFEAYALKRVLMELPQANYSVVQRLSQAITFRRRRFLYRSRHQSKLGVGFFNVSTRTETLSKPHDSAKENTTIGTRTLQNRSINNLQVSERVTKPHTSQASATSASKFQKSQFRVPFVFDSNSVISTAIPASSNQRYSLPIPDAPPIKPGSKEFECPYCCLILPIEETKGIKWRRHVMNDIEPYVCLFEDCGEGHALFRDKFAWAMHMQEQHTIQWSCTAVGHPQFLADTEQTYENHMNSVHAGAFTPDQLHWLKRQSQRPSTVIFTVCPLCGHLPTEMEIQKEAATKGINMTRNHDRARVISSCLVGHLAFHLEQISLISLPWQENFKHVDESEKSASSRVEKDSFESDLEDPALNFDPEENTILQSQVLEEWITETSPYSEAPYPEDEPLLEWSFLENTEYYGHARDPFLQTFLRKWYLDAAPVSYNRNGTFLPACIMPMNPSSEFFGREQELKTIENALLPDIAQVTIDPKPVTFPKTFAIHAPGGMGKTQVAMEFIRRHRQRFDAVFWVYADDHMKLSQGFKDIAIELGLVAEDSVDARDLVYTRNIVKKWLINPVKDLRDVDAENPERATWLMVFDGVEDPDILNDCWPYDGPGSVLITSRSPFSWKSSLQLRPFSSTEATDFLLALTRKDASMDERRAMNNVGNRLGGLPLALAQMAGTIHHRQLSFAKFLASYNEKFSQEELLRPAEKDLVANASGYEHTIASVWAFDNLVRGTELLNITSMLDPDGIPEDILTGPLRDPSLGGFPQTWADFSAARHELIACSLISRNKNENKFFIHRLVQDVARARMTEVEFRRYFMICVKLIASLWPFEPFDWRHSVARWTSCEKLFSHVARLKDLFPQVVESDCMFDDEYLFAKLLTDAGWYHHERGRSSDADFFNDTAQEICRSLIERIEASSNNLASTQAVTKKQIDAILAEIQHNRGCIATEINEPAHALSYQKRFNEMMVEELGNTSGGRDMRLAISWNELGNAYMLINNWERGQECFQRSIILMKDLETFEPTFISLPLVNLGLAYWVQGQYDRAAEILSRGLKDRENAYGPDDRISFITGRFLHALGNVKADQGELDESQNYHHRALLHYKFTLGNNHHRTADTLIKVAEHHLRHGQGEIALALIDHSLKIYSSSPNNPYTPEKARASFRRSDALKVLGRVKAADEELQKCYEMYCELMTPKAIARLAILKSDQPDGSRSRKWLPGQLMDRDLNELITFWSK